jgi:predicted nucleotide-binding protein (sugar kinase/HSP70/actin superfamily)
MKNIIWVESMKSEKIVNFNSLKENVGKFILRDETFVIPQMNKIGGHLLAATFRGFGISAKVMETFKGLDLGNEYTSGKECYPCQITTGDILYFMKAEKSRLGSAFNPDAYVYFMPEAEGPCRFGMYNKYQRIVLDSFPELKRLKIGALSTKDGYSLEGMIEKKRVRDLRKASFISIIVADILDRLLWRIRPYERNKGMADEFIEKAMHVMEDSLEVHGANKEFDKIIVELESLIEEGKGIIDDNIPNKPLIGIVGEIYLRTHDKANQHLIRVLERYGAEVVNASIAEWINFTTYENLRKAKTGLNLYLRQFRIAKVREQFKNIVSFGVDQFYQEMKQKQIFKRIRSLIDLAEDHKVGALEKELDEANLYSFDLGTEACLSLAGILEYARGGFNGVVNVYPFTCMPSTITSSIAKPIMEKLGLPYLDTPYDSSFQPGREMAIRTFMYQAHQNFKRNGRT